MACLPFLAWRRPAPTSGKTAETSFAATREDTRPPGRHSGLPAQAQRQEVAAQLRYFSRTFAESSGRTESDFVQLGHALRALYAAATDLATLVSTRAETLSRTLAESRIAGPDGVAARHLQELRAGLEQTADLLQALGAVGGAVASLQGQVRGLERIGGFLSASVFSFAIESARTPACQEAFGCFIEEMRGLAERIGRLGESISEQVHATRTAHAQGLDGMAAGLEEMRDLGARLDNSATTAAAEAQALLDQAITVLQQAQAGSRHIARQADEAVYYLQFGDIVRQKLEHVGGALEEVAGLLTRPAADSEFGTQAAAAEAVVRIQIGQLELIQQEVAAARSKLEACFRGIRDETDGLAGILNQWRAAGNRDGAGSDPLKTLVMDARQVETLHEQGLALQANARAKAQQATQALAHLAQHLDQVTAINRDMHLQALNAIIKTASLGQEGATLEVLSMHVDSLFRESNQQVTELVSTLQAIVSQAQTAAAASDAPGATESPSGPTHGAWSGELARVGQACEQFDQTTAAAAALAERQQAALEGSRAGLAFLADFGAVLAQPLQGLRALQESLAPWKGSGGASAAATMAALGLQYTMQSERAVHQQTTQSAASADNLELSEPPGSSSTPRPVSAPVPAEAQDPANGPEPEKRAEGAKAPADLGFGDNIEFF